MGRVIKSAAEQLEKIKTNVRESFNYFSDNYRRFNEFYRFLYATSISDDERDVIQELQHPSVEFNILSPHVNRLLSDFMKIDPFFTTRIKDGYRNVNPDIVQVIEAHLRACFTGTDKDTLSYDFYRDMLIGGYSWGKIYTDYVDEMSMYQGIYIVHPRDMTMIGGDPLAIERHKGDGQFVFENFPRTREEIKEEFGNDALNGMLYENANGQFQWSYKGESQEISLLCEYFEKRRKKTKIVKLANGHTITAKQYEDLGVMWEAQGFLEQLPAVVKERKTEIECIDKYVLCGSKILEYYETDFPILPLVFFDGDSAMIRRGLNSQIEQMTRPYIFPARDTQRMKNFAGQMLCNEIENIGQNPWVCPKESLPTDEQAENMWLNPQKAALLTYNTYATDNPDKPLPPPFKPPRTPIPGEILATFQLCDSLAQVQLGSYDAAIATQNKEFSGKAIRLGNMQSNANAMPYMKGFLCGWNRLAQGYLSLLPKYYVTPRTIPIRYPDGKRGYQEINQPDAPYFDYNLNALAVEVEAGVNYDMQKELALEMLFKLMGSMQVFNEFMNQVGLEVVLDNLDIRGIDNLKVLASQFMESKQQAAQQQSQQLTPQQMAEMELKLQEMKLQLEDKAIEQKRESAHEKTKTDLVRTMLDDAAKNRESDMKFIEVMTKMQSVDVDKAIAQEKIDAEDNRSAVQLAIHLDSQLSKMESKHGNIES